jgi:4-carboxymuconolactone decarboxylase
MQTPHRIEEYKMTDFPILTREELNPDQRHWWNEITRGPRGFYCGGPDSKRVPDLYNAWLQFPELGQALHKLADALRVKKELNGKYRELLVLTTSAALGARTEYTFHIPFARNQGLSDEVISSICERRTPTFIEEDERVIYEANIQLLETATLTDPMRQAVIGLIGYPGLVQLMAAVMLYVITAYTTNVARVEVLDDFSADQNEMNAFWSGKSKTDLANT